MQDRNSDAQSGIAENGGSSLAMQQDPWFALRVFSRKEKRVMAALESKGYTPFLPVVRRRQKWADRYKTVEFPLFAGYVFCRFSDRAGGLILTTPGVIDIVRRGREIAPVETSEIEALQLLMRTNLAYEPWDSLIVGERARIAAGPLANLAGTVTDIRKAPRFVLSVTLLNRSVLVEVERDWLVPLRESGTRPAQAIGKAS